MTALEKMASIAKKLVYAALAVAILYDFPPTWFPLIIYQQTIDAGSVAKNGAHSYYVDLPAVAALRPDGPEKPFVSNVTLLEDGSPIGPAHAPHKDIADLGGGRFSHWVTTLVFSTSDNSDPRTNGKTYTINAKYIPPSLVFLLALPLAVLLFRRAVGDEWMPVLQAALLSGLLIIWVKLLHGFVAYYPDAYTYYSWHIIVPLGYPLFLSAIGSLPWVPVAQLTVLCGAMWFLCLAVNRISTTAGLATLLLLACSTHMFYEQASILSEALFLPLLLVNVGAAIFTITTPEKRLWPFLVALSAASIMFVRPAGYYAPLGILFLLLSLRPYFTHLMKWMFAPLLIFLSMTFMINLAVRGAVSQSQVGRVLFPHVAVLFDPSFSPEADRDIAIVVETAIRPYREKFERETDLLSRARFSMNNYNSLLSDVEWGIKATHKYTTGIEDNPAHYRYRLDKLYLRLFMATIRNRPLGYLGLVRDQIVGAWSYGILIAYNPVDYMLGAERGQIEWRKKEIALREIPLSTDHLIPDSSRYEGFTKALLDTLSDFYKRIQQERWLAYSAGVLSFLAIPLAWLRPTHRMTALGYCGVMIHGSILLTCATSVFIPRYAVPADPLLLLSGAILVDGAARMLSAAFGLRKKKLAEEASNRP